MGGIGGRSDRLEIICDQSSVRTSVVKRRTLRAMAVGHVARALWRRKVIVLVAVLLTVGAAAWSLSSAPKVYESSAKVLLLPDASNPTLVPFYGQAVEN